MAVLTFQVITESDEEPAVIDEEQSNDEQLEGESTAHALRKTNQLLSSLVKRIDRQDKSIAEMAKNYQGASHSTPTRKAVNRQKEVPLQVRVSVIIATYS